MGKIINGVKYMLLSSNIDNLKIQSFEHRTYITLREIFLNADAFNICSIANRFNEKLSGGIPYDDRKCDFQYTNVLHEKQYLRELSNWLNSISEYFFEFADEDTVFYDDEKHTYMKFDEWWENFESLRQMLNNRVSEIALESTRNLWIPPDYEIPNIHHL